MIKIIPHVDCTPRICELVRYYMRGRDAEGRVGRAGGAAALRPRPVRRRRLPVREVVSASHYVADLTLGLGEVVFDYLAEMISPA